MSSLWLIFAVLTQCSATITWKSIENKITDEIWNLTNNVVSTYFSQARCVGIITEKPSLSLTSSDLPVYYITLNRSNVGFDNLLLAAANEGCRAFVLQVKDVMWMAQTFSDLFYSAGSYYRENRRYLYLPPDTEYDKDSWEIAINEVFSSKMMDWMPDLLIANLINTKETLHKRNFRKQRERSRSNVNEAGKLQVPKEADFILEINTHRFVGKTPSEKLLLDVWVPDQGFLYGLNLYYDKVKNVMGKQLKIAAIPYPPFTAMKLDTEPPVFDGMEFRIMFEFGKKYNATWKVFCDLENLWGDVWDNGSGNGVMGDTASDRVDFGISALYPWLKEYLHLDYSVVYFFSGITAVTPKPKLLPGWLLPLRPFNIHMWFAVLASVLIVTVILYATSKASQTLLGGSVHNRYSTIMECGFRTAGLLVLQIPDDERDYSTPRHVPMRHLVSWLILFFLVVSSAYGGGLSSILTLPQLEPPIDTPKELADSGLLWYGADPCYILGIKFSSDPVMQTLTRNFIVRPKEELAKLAYDDIGVVVERTQGGHFADVNIFTEEMMENKRILKEDIVNSYVILLLRKGSPYKENINSHLSQVRESGLLPFWEGMTVRNFHIQRLQQSVIGSNAAPDVQRIKLSLSHVQGAFLTLGVGLILASAIFLLEFLRFRYAEKKGMVHRN